MNALGRTGATVMLVMASAGALATCAAPAESQASADDPASDPVSALKMVPTFDDKFDGNAIDPAKWDRVAGSPSITDRTMANNAERQVYIDPDYLRSGVKPISVADGTLTITATR